MTLDLLIITPDSPSAAALDRAYLGTKNVRACSAWSTHGIRARKLIVFPAPSDWSAENIERYARAVQEGAARRLTKDGEMIQL